MTDKTARKYRPYVEQVGARLRELRTQRGLSLFGVEQESGGQWRAVVVGSYERADRSPTLESLAGLAAFYGVPVADLLPDERSTLAAMDVIRAFRETADRLGLLIPAPRVAGDLEQEAAESPSMAEQEAP